MEQVTTIVPARPTMAPLYQLLIDSTVRIKTPSGSTGTGFFVFDGHLLTCVHVVKDVDDYRQIEVHHQGVIYYVNHLEKLTWPYPDLAMLSIRIEEDHACVKLGFSVLSPGQQMYSFGYTQQLPNGESFLTTLEGIAYWSGDGTQQPVYKLKESQVVPGLSGGPLMDLSTGMVVGVMKTTRDEYQALGGHAIPVEQAYENWPHIEKSNTRFHKDDLRWYKSLEQQGDFKLKEAKKITNSVIRSGMMVDTLRGVFYITVLVEGQFKEFTNEKKEALIDELREMLDAAPDTLYLLQLREGSILLDISIDGELLDRLVNLIVADGLKKIGIKSVTGTGFTNYEVAEQEADSVQQLLSNLFWQRMAKHYQALQQSRDGVLDSVFGRIEDDEYLLSKINSIVEGWYTQEQLIYNLIDIYDQERFIDNLEDEIIFDLIGVSMNIVEHKTTFDITAKIEVLFMLIKILNYQTSQLEDLVQIISVLYQTDLYNQLESNIVQTKEFTATLRDLVSQLIEPEANNVLNYVTQYS